MPVEPTQTKQPDSPESAIRRFQANLDDEIDGIAVYRLLANAEQDPERRRIFDELRAVEERHAETWREKLIAAGATPRERGPSLKVRMIGFGARVFGVRSMLPMVRALEAGAFGAYMAQDATAQAMAPDEREHRKILTRLERGRPSPDEPSEAILSRERWHRSGGGGTLRASIFGASDGLVSNTALVMGFAGAQASGDFVLLAGIAGLLAGAFSMAAGEYVSMRAQRELFERQIELERSELELAPEEEQRELSLIFQAKGLRPDEADMTAARLMEDPEIALDTLVREELGLDPSELGSPWGAATGSFLAFAVGAMIPVIPFLFADASTPFVVASALMSALALFLVGAGVSLFTGRGTLYSGLRQVGLGAAAAVVTFVIGRIIGVSTDI
ncbi:MAG TPA: VIT1/CCC1 transporter family protein [Dehalococcoidia bacterium]|nr:VIT1/CCC1 transporter family protein [Dehalococcoidia bacterium]